MFSQLSVAMPVNMAEIIDDLALVHQSPQQFQSQLHILTHLHQRLRKISENQKNEPDLIWIIADQNDNNRYAVGQFLRMFLLETGESWSWLINQVVSSDNYFQLVIDHMHNKVIFYDEIPGVFETHWILRLKENLSDCSVIVVLDHSNVIDQLDLAKKSTIDYIIDVRAQGCETILTTPPPVL